MKTFLNWLYKVMCNLAVLIIAVTLIALACIGCIPESMYPMPESTASTQFLLDNDPCAVKHIQKGKNALGYNNLAGGKIIETAIAYVKTTKENDLVGKLNTLNSQYAIAKKDQAQLNKASQEGYDMWFGANGIVTAGLFGIGGTLLGGFAWGQRMKSVFEAKANSMLTQAEADEQTQNATAQVTTELTQKLWTTKDVADEAFIRIRETCILCGMTDPAKIEEIVKAQVAKTIAEV